MPVAIYRDLPWWKTFRLNREIPSSGVCFLVEHHGALALSVTRLLPAARPRIRSESFLRALADFGAETIHSFSRMQSRQSQQVGCNRHRNTQIARPANSSKLL